MLDPQAKRWIQEKFPYWNRRGGRDHIWMMTNDEGACWMPTGGHMAHACIGMPAYGECFLVEE